MKLQVIFFIGSLIAVAAAGDSGPWDLDGKGSRTYGGKKGYHYGKGKGYNYGKGKGYNYGKGKGHYYGKEKVIEKPLYFAVHKSGASECFDLDGVCDRFNDAFSGFEPTSIAGASAAANSLCEIAEAALAEFDLLVAFEGKFSVTREPDGDVSKINLETSVFQSNAVLVYADTMADSSASVSTSAMAMTSVSELCDATMLEPFGPNLCGSANAEAEAVSEATAQSTGAAYAGAEAGSETDSTTLITVEADDIRFFKAAVGVTGSSYALADAEATAESFAEAFSEAAAESFVEICERNLESECRACAESSLCNFDSCMAEYSCISARPNASAAAQAAIGVVANAFASAFSNIVFEVNALAVYKKKYGEDFIGFDGGVETEDSAPAYVQTYCASNDVPAPI